MSYEAPAGLVNLEAEAALLGAVLADNALLPDVLDVVSPRDFHDPLHGRIFNAAQRTIARGALANEITLRPVFESDPAIADVGGVGYLATLVGSGIARIGARDFARQIADLASRRRVHREMVRAAEQIVEDQETPAFTVAAEVNAVIWEATAQTEPVRARTAADSARTVRKRGEDVRAGVATVGLMCRFISDINVILGPVERGTYNVIGGRPGMGKSSIAQSMALGFAANGHPVEYFHLEMTAEQMDIRVTSDLAHAMNTPLPHAVLRKGELSQIEDAHLSAVEEAAAALPIRFTAARGWTLGQIDAAVARAVAYWRAQDRELACVVVDYMQLVEVEENGKRVTDRFVRVSRVSRGMLDIAQRHNVALFALAQVNRGVEERADKRPNNSDLKDSGDIEQDADTIMFAYREEYYLAREKPKPGQDKELDRWDLDMKAVEGKIELIGTKVRHGPTRTRTAKFRAEHFAVRGGDFHDGLYEDSEPLLAF